MKEDYNIETIESWLAGALDKDAQATFEARLQSDEDFRNSVELHQKLIEGIEFAGEEDIRSKLKETQSQLSRMNFFEQNQKVIKMTQTKKTGRRWLPIAASFALLAAAAMFFFNQQPSKPDINSLFAEYYEPETKILSSVMDRLEAQGLADPETTTADDSLMTALKQYEKFEYTSARTSLTKYLNAYPENQTARFYMGLTQLQLSNYAKAIDDLLPLCTEEGFPNQDAAKWYLSMCYTQLEGPDGITLAGKYLKDLAMDNTSTYQSTAKAYKDALGIK